MNNTVVKFQRWSPDLPDLDNPGLTLANDCVPADGTYKPFLPISAVGSTLGSTPYGAVGSLSNAGVAYIYAGTSTGISLRVAAGWSARGRATVYALTSADYWRFAQYEQTLIGTDYVDLPQYHTLGGGGVFADLIGGNATAPAARQVGVVNRFVVFGDTNDSVGVVPNRIRWSGYDDHTDWPVPGSSTATANQAGAQTFDAQWREVTGVAPGEQYGVVFQRGAVHRMTYVGGNVVFQFDTIERGRGNICPNGLVQIGAQNYFLSADGFYVTDGIQVVPIGASQIDNRVLSDVDATYLNRVYGAVDYQNQNIYWAYPGSGHASGQPNKIVIFNYREQRWTEADQVTEGIFSGLTFAITLDQLDTYFASIDLTTPSLDAQAWKGGNNQIMGFTSGNALGAFSGSAGTTVLETQEIEFVPGGYATLLGVKPLVQEGGQSPTITVQVGTRDSQGGTVTWGSATSLTTRTRTADFRSTARYHRVRVNLVGAYDAAMGIEFAVVPTGRA